MSGQYCTYGWLFLNMQTCYKIERVSYMKDVVFFEILKNRPNILNIYLV